MPDDPALDPLEAEGQPDSRPDYLMDKFKTVDEQARAYAESERKMREMSEHQARQDEFIQQLAVQMEAQPQEQQYADYGPSQGTDPLTAQMEMALAEGDAQTALAIQAWVAQQVANQTIAQAQQQQMQSGETEAAGAMFVKMVEDEAKRQFGNDPEWEELEGEVGALLQHKGHLIRQTTNPLEAAEDLLDAVRMVQARKGTAPQGDNPDTRGIEGALSSVGIQGDRGKRLAQSLSGAGVRTAGSPDDDTAYFERVKAARGNEWRG